MKERYLFAISQRNNGGAERAICQLANAVCYLGFEVHFVQLFANPNDYDLCKEIKVHIVKQPDCKNKLVRRLLHIVRSIKVIRSISADYVIPMLEVMTYIGYFATRFTKSTLISTIRNNPNMLPKKLIERKFRDYICRASEAIFVQNEAQRAYFSEKLRSKTFVLPNIVNESFVSKEIIYSGEIRKFVTAGRLNEQKNQMLLVETFSKIIKNSCYKNVVLTIYGQGPEEKRLRKRIEELSLEQNIMLGGRNDDLANTYMDFDAFVLSSNFEGMPNALMEAMAIGLPCISTNCPTGPSDLICNGENGYLVKMDDSEALEKALISMICNPIQAQRMGKKARDTIIKKYSAEEIGRKFIDECCAHRKCYTAKKNN